MCGINGFNFKNENLIELMNDKIKHRGPDGTGIFCNENISLGHNLLAITETAYNSKQPVVSQDKNFVLVYNGEIYNYLELRIKLEKSGIVFNTNSDTEVLFKGLKTEGREFIKKLDGMFAFAWYDGRGQNLLLARDKSGMKPLYYYKQKNKFIFSSEIKGIFSHNTVDRKLDCEALNIFFALGYVPGEKTVIKNIYKVRPGEILNYNLKTNQINKIWFEQEKRYKNLEFGKDKLQGLINHSTKNHTMGLRPFGLYLSGGLDSTVILHELAQSIPAKVKTYTTRFVTDNKIINEDADRAQKLCKDYNIEHRELLVSEEDFIQAIEKTAYTVEEPRYNFSLPAYWLLSQYASRDIVVALLGNGGDELFLGYDRYLESKKINQRFEQYPKWLVNLKNSLRAQKDCRISFPTQLKLHKLIDRWVYLNSINRLDPGNLKQIYKFYSGTPFNNLINYLNNYDHPVISNSLPDFEKALGELDKLLWLADEDFLRSDKILMQFGMEGRFPFLAQDLVTYANSISSQEKLKDGVAKSLIRQTYQGKLPDYIINKEKTGWYAPTVEWMHSKLGDMVKEVLSSNYYNETAELFDLEYVRKNYVEKVDEFSQANVKKFLPIFFFQVWAKKFNIKV